MGRPPVYLRDGDAENQSPNLAVPPPGLFVASVQQHGGPVPRSMSDRWGESKECSTTATLIALSPPRRSSRGKATHACQGPAGANPLPSDRRATFSDEGKPCDAAADRPRPRHRKDKERAGARSEPSCTTRAVMPSSLTRATQSAIYSSRRQGRLQLIRLASHSAGARFTYTSLTLNVRPDPRWQREHSALN